ncbi:hypothetical protein [Streptomyces sp. NPDC000851]
MGKVHRLAVVAATAVTCLGTVSVGNGSAATASEWPVDRYLVDGTSTNVYTQGSVTWGNRTAELTGWVDNNWPRGWTTAYFEAYAGTTKIASTTRTDSSGGSYTSYRFTIGDPNRVGGFDRVKIQVCWDTAEGDGGCGTPRHYWRDSIASKDW